MPQKKKITSVLELGRYSIGQTVYWVTICQKQAEPIVEDQDEWMFDTHPMHLYTIGPYKRIWPRNIKVPKLHEEDFRAIVSLLQTELIVGQFLIADISRCTLTGDYYYVNEHNTWMPQQNLFDTETAAYRERNRILKLINKWVKIQG